MARPTPEEKLLIEDRRRKVTALWLARVTQEEIGRRVGATQQTVSRDIQAVKAEYKAERHDLIDQDAAVLDSMEQECALRYQRDKAGEWIDRRLRVIERRSRLLGLDAPQKLEQSGPGGGALVLKWEDGSSEPES